MASLNQWKTDSTAVPPVPPPANPTFTAAQTLTVPGVPRTLPANLLPSALNPNPTPTGTKVNPYQWPLPVTPLLTNHGPKTPPMGPQFAAPVITTGRSLANVTHGAAMTAVNFAATGGVAPVTWTVQGGLPAGLTLTSAGVLSGTPTAAGGPFKLTITATDSRGVKNWDVFTLTVV